MDLGEVARAGALSQARMIYRAIFASAVGRRIIVLLALLVVAILANTFGQVVLNRWQKPFYDAITRRDLHDFLYQLAVYFGIVGTLRLPGCSDVPGSWNGYAGGFYLRSSSACVPLVFAVGQRSAVVRVGVGRRCGPVPARPAR